MNLYKLHAEPESLDHHDLAHGHIVELFFYKYWNNPIELKKREKQIARSAFYSYEYALKVLKGPFKLGEAAITTSACHSCDYARKFLNGPFHAGEAAIATDAYYSYEYVRTVLKGPFLKGEAVIAGTHCSLYYDKFIKSLKGDVK